MTDFLQFTIYVQNSHEQHKIFARGLQSAIEVGSGIFERLLRTVTTLLLLLNNWRLNIN